MRTDRRRAASSLLGTDLLVFAHQDDEFAAFALLDRARQQGRPATCVYLTSGDPGGCGSPARDAESRAVLARFGVPPERTHFLGRDHSVPDGALHLHADRLLPALVELVRRSSPIASIFVPAFEGGHQDHDAAHVVAVAAASWTGALQRTYQYPLYTACGRPGLLFRSMSPMAANGLADAIVITPIARLRYVRNCCAYPSQWRTWLLLLPSVLARYLLVGRQFMQPVAFARLREAPHESAPLYERRGILAQESFAESLRSFIDRNLPEGAPGD